MSMLVGIAGLDSLGKAIGERLRSAGLRVLGYDADVQAAALSGLRTVGSAERLARECELEIVTCEGEQATGLVNELLAIGDLHQLRTIIMCGSLEPRIVRTLAEAASARGIELVDAPFEGGEEAIAASRAVIFAAGTRAAVDRCAPVFQACGRSVHVVDAGSGQIARIVNRLLRWSNVLAVNDAFSLAQASGADPVAVREAVLASSGASRALEEWSRGWSDPVADLQGVPALAQDNGASLPFLGDVPGLVSGLDLPQLQGLFNLGIADLSQPESEAAPAEAVLSEEPPAEEAALDEQLAPVEDDPFEASAGEDASVREQSSPLS